MPWSSKRVLVSLSLWGAALRHQVPRRLRWRWSLNNLQRHSHPTPNLGQLLMQKWLGTSLLVEFQNVQSWICSEGSLQLMLACMLQVVQNCSELMTAVRSSPSSLCSREWSLEMGNKNSSLIGREDVEEGESGKKRWVGERGPFLNPITCTPKGSATLLHSSQLIKMV